MLIPAISAVCILASLEYLDTQKINSGEYYALILFGTVGMVLMSSAVELVLIFIALEISSISTYILAGYRRRNAVKRGIIHQVFPAGFLCHRILSLRRGPDVRRNRIHQHSRNSAALWQSQSRAFWPIMATALMIVGLGFKVACGAFPHLDARRL